MGHTTPPARLGASRVYEGGRRVLARPGQQPRSRTAGIRRATPDNHADKDLYVLLPHLM